MMYHILIVDDERLIVEGMRRTLSRLEVFDIMVAFTGLEAYEILRKGGIDAMLLDINMPEMTGIELMKKLHEDSIEVLTIVISGYEEFEYVQEALRYGATDYLLKPLSPKDVASTGMKLYEQLSRSAYEAENQKKLRQFVLENRNVIKQRLLSDILKGSIRNDRIREMWEIYGIDLRGEYFTAIVIYVRGKVEVPEMAYQMKLRFIEETIERIIENVPEANLFNMENARYVLLLNSVVPMDPDFIGKLLDEMERDLSKTEDIDVYIGKGNEVSGPESIRYSYNQANEALDYRSMFKSEHVFDIGDYRKNDVMSRMQAQMELIADRLKHMKYSAADDEIGSFFMMLEDTRKDLSTHQIAFCLFKCSTLLMTVMMENGMTNTDEFIQDIYYHLDDAADTCMRLKKSIQAMMAIIAKDIFKSYSEKESSISMKVCEYIHQHYAETDLSVKKISDELGYSAKYLGNAFRREFGDGINDYMNRYRIDMAKKLMTETDMMVYEIAYAVGFGDHHYFSKIFKKVTNSSPSDYKRKQDGRQNS